MNDEINTNTYISALEAADNAMLELEKVTEKHWEECRQIALYDDELRRAKELLKNRECYIRDLEHELGYDKCNEEEI